MVNKRSIPPQMEEEEMKPSKIIEIICSLIPNLSRAQVEYKFQKYPNDKKELLRSCISQARREGFDVSMNAICTLERWQNEALNGKGNFHSVKRRKKSKEKSFHHLKNIQDNPFNNCNDLSKSDLNQDHDVCINLSKASNVPPIDKINLKEKIKFLSEVIPGLDTKKVTEELQLCSSPEEVEVVTSRYLEEYVTSISEIKIEQPNSSVAPVKNVEKMPLEKDISHASFSELLTQLSEKAQSHINETDKGCMIVNVVKKSKPIVINLDEDASSPASNGSDVLLVDEVLAKTDNNEVLLDELTDQQPPSEDKQKVNSSPQGLEIDKLPGNTLEKEPLMEDVVDIETDAVPWKEAEAICKLLPFLQLNNIHQSIMDNYYHPQRKAKVLMEYIGLALEEEHELSSDVFDTLSQWQKNNKIVPIHNFENLMNGSYQPQKAIHEFPPPYPLDSASTSRNQQIDIPMEQLPPPKESLATNAPIDVQTLFNSYPEETKSWYLKKIDFIEEITSNLSRQYILSQIIHCQTDSDVTLVTSRLLEEQATAVPQTNSVEMDKLPLNLEAQDIGAVGGVTPTVSGEVMESSSSREDTNVNQLSAADIEDRIQAHIQQLGEIFSDADPDFLSERANELAGDNDKFAELIVELTDNRSYPKMEEYLKRQQKMNMRKKFIEGMSVEEFMEYFEDPEKVFCDTAKEMNKLYITNAKAQLMKDLPFHLSKTIDSVFRLNNFHYLPTLRKLRTMEGARKTKRTVGGKQPGDLDDIFIKELCYAKMEDKIKEHYRCKEKDKEMAFQTARENGELKECQCCYDDEVLTIDMSTCENSEDAHFFCNVCIKRYSEEQIGQGKQDFVCLQGECKSPFSLNTLKKLLKPSIFSNLLKRKQAEEIAAAGIEDLESCPFCNFATIMPNKEDRVFKCLNPECLKDSCRLCKELNHIPLRCEEVEKKKQTDARTYLENEMSEAMVRECYKCKKRFIKEEGCNKMVCSCGAMMCYLCKMPIKGYDHFAHDSRSTTKTNQNKCPLWTNSLQLHAEEVQQRAAEAKQKLDPNVDLVHDPTTDLPQVPDYLKKPQANHPPNNGAGPRGNGRQDHMDQFRHQFDNPANYFPRIMADMLMAENRRIQQHSHQHRHHHFYLPLLNSIPPPPAHLPPPPPAHQPQQPPPFPPFMEPHYPPSGFPLLPPPPTTHSRSDTRPSTLRTPTGASSAGIPLTAAAPAPAAPSAAPSAAAPTRIPTAGEPGGLQPPPPPPPEERHSQPKTQPPSQPSSLPQQQPQQ